MEKNYKFIACFALALITSACGGGGGGSGTPENSMSSRSEVVSSSQSSSSASSRDPSIAYAGLDRTVNMGQKVTLDAGVTVANPSGGTLSPKGFYFETVGTSAVPTDIVKLRWEQISGPVIQEYGGTPFFTFTAPPVGTEDKVVMKFKLQLTFQDGHVSEDFVDITVNRVNKPPIALTGPSLKTASGSIVTLSSGNSCDPDGVQLNYKWNQISGPSVNLLNSTSPNANFTAPQVDQETVMVFRLTITDKNGISSSQNLEVFVNNPTNPTLNVDFPVSGKLVSDLKTVTAFGRVSAVEGSTITKVTVDSGSGATDAILGAKGTWKLSNVDLKNATVVTVTAYDSVGRTSQKKIAMREANYSLGWRGTQTLSYDGVTGNVLAMSGPLQSETNNASFYLIGDVSLYNISSSGNRTMVASPYCPAGDPTIVWRGSTVLGNGLFVASNERNVDSHIMRVDLLTGLTTSIAGPEIGSGEVATFFGTPIADKKNNRLLLTSSDEINGKLISIDVDTYERKRIMNTSQMAFIALDPASNTLYSTTGSVFDTPKFHKTLLTSTDPISVLISQFGTLGEGAEPKTIRMNGFKGLYVDSSQDGRLLVLDALGNLITIDAETGNREQIFNNNYFITAATLTEQGLLYFTENTVNANQTTNQSLMVVDLDTGVKIRVTQ